MQDFTANAQIKHLNIRKQGEEQEVLAVDVKMTAEISADVIDAIMCDGLNEGAALHCFWMQSDKSPMFPQIGEVPFSREYKNVRAKLADFTIEGVTLKKFSFVPMKDERGDLTFSMAVTEPPAKLIDTLASMLADSLLVQFSCPQGDMLDTPVADAGKSGPVETPPTATDELAYMQAVDEVRVSGNASVSFIQRRLNIGYNKAARLIERMEEEGIVGPTGIGGRREILRASA